MINWFKKIWYGLGGLNDLEWLILNAVREKLAPEAIVLWDAQIYKFNKVSRLPDGVESIFYFIDLKKGKPDFDESIRFPNRQSDLLLANVRLKSQSDKIDVEVWCEAGRLLLLSFKGSANHWLEYLGCDGDDDFKLDIECEIQADLIKSTQY